MLDSLLGKTSYGVLIDLTKYIHIPILQYSPKNIINENPYILLEDIRSEYELVKGRAGEIDFWEKVKIMFAQGKVRGYEDERVYPINEEQAIVETPKNYATLYFWGPDASLEEEEEDWLLENAEDYFLYIEDNPTFFNIYVLDIKR